MALYKKNEDGSWLKADEYVVVPVTITRDNLQQGWEYHESDPLEYVEYINTQNTPPVFDDNMDQHIDVVLPVEPTNVDDVVVL